MATKRPMKLGVVGLGRMGTNISRRLIRDGHSCVVFDVSATPVKRLQKEGAIGARSLEDLISKLEVPRVVWVMVPSGDITGQTINDLASLLDRGDTIIDGGNSYYRDDMTRATTLFGQGLHLIDCGTSGGVWGIERGYCLMIGGEPEIVAKLEPIFLSIAPGHAQGLRRSRREECARRPLTIPSHTDAPVVVLFDIDETLVHTGDPAREVGRPRSRNFTASVPISASTPQRVKQTRKWPEQPSAGYFNANRAATNFRDSTLII